MLSRSRTVVFLLLAWLAAPMQAVAFDWTGMTLDGVACSGKGQGFGPWDFYDVNDPTDEKYEEGRWWEVKIIHQKPGLEALNAIPFDQIEYNRAADEFDYILRAFPNHPQILGAAIQLELKRRKHKTTLYRWQTPPECYLQRAKVFRPKQPHIDQLMGYYMQRLGRTEDALVYYNRALEIDPEYAEVYYNIGLAYFDIGKYDMALQNAHMAYELGFPLRGLRRRLERVGAWKAAVETTPVAQETSGES